MSGGSGSTKWGEQSFVYYKIRINFTLKLILKFKVGRLLKVYMMQNFVMVLQCVYVRRTLKTSSALFEHSYD